MIGSFLALVPLCGKNNRLFRPGNKFDLRTRGGPVTGTLGLFSTYEQAHVTEDAVNPMPFGRWQS